MAEQEAVVRVRSERCERVTESEEFVGKLRVASRLPQYLLWIQVSGIALSYKGEKEEGGNSGVGYILDDSNVNWGSSAGPINCAIGICHFCCN